MNNEFESFSLFEMNIIYSKMIQLMSERLTSPIHSENDVIQYFYEKAKEEMGMM